MKNIYTEDKLRDLLEAASLNNDGNGLREASILISTDITNKQLELSEYVENLGFALTSPTLELRVAGTKLLSETISQLTADFLNATQLNFITTFYCDRLKDQHSVQPAVLKGIFALISMENLSDGHCTKLLQNIFHNIVCQSQVREDRLVIFQILQQLSEQRTKEMLAMGTDFVYGVINAIDGERDPRLLVFIFNFLPKFLHTYPLKHLTEEMFEVCACYFPIDFNPSQSDPASITRDVLADKLADCLAAKNEFAEYCIPLLLEKLESDLNVAKLDSLALLVKCVEKYSPITIDEYFPAIWTTLKMELIPGTNADILPMALHTLKQLIVSVANDTNVCNNIMIIIFQTILNPLTNIDKRFFASSTNVAYTCARASPLTAEIVTNKLLPIFLSQFPTNKKDNSMANDHCIVQQKQLLELIVELIEICLEKNCVNTIESSYISAMETEIQLCLSSTNDQLIDFTLKVSAKICPTISECNRKLIYAIIVQRLLNGNGKNYEILIKSYGKTYPNEIMTNIIMKLIEINFHTIQSSDIIDNILAAICSCATMPEFTAVCLTFLIEQIFQKRQSANHRVLQQFALTHLMKLIKSDPTIIQELHKKYEIIKKTFEIIHESNDNEATLLVNSNVLQKEIMQILQIIMEHLCINEQTNILQHYLPNINVQKNVNDIYLLAGIIGHTSETIEIPNLYEIIGELIKLSINNCKELIIVQICNELLCSLYNKCNDNDLINASVIRLCEQIETENRTSALITLSWITKGLLVKGHTNATSLIYKLIDLLDHNKLGPHAAIAFQNISTDLPMIHLPIVKILFKQKLFQIMLNKLTQRLHEFSHNHLIAMAYIMEQVSHHVLTINLEKIGPILFKCLKSNMLTPSLIALNVMKQFFEEQNEYFQNHFQHIIGDLITLCTYKESMKIRIAALQCLQMICIKYPTIALLSYKMDITHGLESVLDDQKRLVRNEAVKTRNLWFLVGNEK